VSTDPEREHLLNQLASMERANRRWKLLAAIEGGVLALSLLLGAIAIRYYVGRLKAQRQLVAEAQVVASSHRTRQLQQAHQDMVQRLVAEDNLRRARETMERVGQHQPPGPAPLLDDDLKRLQGDWKPARGPDGTRRDGQLTFDKHKLVVTYHALSTGRKAVDVRTATIPFDLNEDGETRVITPAKEQGLASIPYRFDGDALILEGGEVNLPPRVSLKGRWESVKGEKIP
jgi:hypothetical protein